MVVSKSIVLPSMLVPCWFTLQTSGRGLHQYMVRLSLVNLFIVFDSDSD